MQVQLRSVRLSGWLGLLLILGALVVLPFALLFALVMLVLGLLGGLLGILLGRKPRTAPDSIGRPPVQPEETKTTKVLDAEYEVKDEP